jgi:hypothetical protein
MLFLTFSLWPILRECSATISDYSENLIIFDPTFLEITWSCVAWTRTAMPITTRGFVSILKTDKMDSKSSRSRLNRDRTIN